MIIPPSGLPDNTLLLITGEVLGGIAGDLGLRVNVGVQKKTLIVYDPLQHFQTQKQQVLERLRELEIAGYIVLVIKATLYPEYDKKEVREKAPPPSPYVVDPDWWIVD